MSTTDAVGEPNWTTPPSASQDNIVMETRQRNYEQMVQCMQTMEIFVQQLSETQNVLKSELNDAVVIQKQMQESAEIMKRCLRRFINTLQHSQNDENVESTKWHKECDRYEENVQSEERIYESSGDQAKLCDYKIEEEEQPESLPFVQSKYHVNLDRQNERVAEKPKGAKKFKGWFSWHGFKKKHKSVVPKSEESHYHSPEENAIENAFQEEAFAEIGRDEASSEKYETENSYSLKTVAEYTLQPKEVEIVEVYAEKVLPSPLTTNEEEEPIQQRSERSASDSQTNIEEAGSTVVIEFENEYEDRFEKKEVNSVAAESVHECVKENFDSLMSTDSGVEPPECFEIHFGQVDENASEFEKHPFGFEPVSCRSLTLQTPDSPQSAYLMNNDDTYFESAYVGTATEKCEKSMESSLVADGPVERFASQLHSKLMNSVLSSTGMSTLQTFSKPLLAAADTLSKLGQSIAMGNGREEDGKTTLSCSSVSVKSIGSQSAETTENSVSSASLVSYRAQRSAVDSSNNVSNFDAIQTKMAAVSESCATCETSTIVSKSCDAVVSLDHQSVHL